MIFPGMDPYLEAPSLWMGVHNRLIVYISDQLRPKLRPRYVANIEERVYLEAPDRHVRPDLLVKRLRRPRPGAQSRATATMEADVPIVVWAPREEVHEPYLEIIDLENGRKVVTVLEILSPTNKASGPGRDSYLAKQADVLSSDANLVEIDLLRTGPHVMTVPEDEARSRVAYDYLVCVNRAQGPRDRFELYPRRLRERLPRILVPLAEGDADVVLDLQAVIEQTHEAGSYLDQIDYGSPCVPALPPEDQAWADGLIAAGGPPEA